jgi:penicillin-binding protein 2
MKFLRWLNIIVLMTFLLGACSSNGGVQVPNILSRATETPLPQALVTISPAPDANAAMSAYLDAFKKEDYNTMYSMLSKAAQDSISLEDFAKKNRDTLNTMSASSFDYTINSSLVNPYSSEVSYNVNYHTALVGDIQRDMVARFALENGEWKLNWDSSLILPELTGGNVLSMDYSVPARGNIYDRNGDVLAAQSDAFAFSILPGNVNEKSEPTLLTEVQALCGNNPEDLAAQIASTPAQWPITLCVASADESERIRNINPSGLEFTPFNSRYYFEQGVGSNFVGYTLAIPPEKLDEYRRLGYRGDERVGADGIEAWAEDYLAGKHGGALYVVDASGNPVTKVGESAPKAADSVYLTIDRNLQKNAQDAIKGFTGAVVVLERDSGKVLAMASSPGFDSNMFSPENPNAGAQYAELNQSFSSPLLNRATMGQYPLGSVFKIITMAAGMESGLYTPETTLDCQYHWSRLSDTVRNDWTWDHCQTRLGEGKECNTSDSTPSGVLTLPQGLMRSCNPFFWDIGYTLYQNDRAADIAKMARAFGLGQKTGINQVSEEAGNIQDPTDPVEVVNQAIGQGTVQVTPLQVARFIAAVGNGGTLYRPQLVDKIEPVDGTAADVVFKPEAQGTLPIQPFRLQTIQDAMRSVVEDPRGTANYRLRGLSIPVAGKTGTAESGSGKPHAWFAGYTMASEATNMPDIAIAVILENQGEGSDWAAPVFKRIVESYYYGSPRSLYWFESSFGVTDTPTPLGGIPTETPKP